MAERSLADTFRRLIRSGGPITLTQYMGESNARYYASRDPLGDAGDFVTAPEISQMFGELIGLWLVDIWTRAGRPEPVCYVELGPGRGTLASDALRVMRGQGLTPGVHMVEGSPELRQIQAQAVPGAVFHDDLSTLPGDVPLLLVANEFLDALPIRQLVKTGSGWREVLVGLDGEESFAPVAGAKPMDAAVGDAWHNAAEGTIVETCPAAASVVEEVAQRLAAQGGAALFVDYGHAEPRTGSTLQAVRRHKKVDAFALPGECDLTAHVDFDQARRTAEAAGARWLGTTTQGAFLRALGIDQRTNALSRSAPERAASFATDRDRLVASTQMGELFKVMGLASPDWPGGVGLQSVAVLAS